MTSKPITTKTPVDAQVEKILAKYFPSVETFEPRNMDSLDFHEVFVADIKRAVAEAFAAGRDFEGTRRDRRAQRDEKTERKAKIRCAHCGEEGERAGHQGCQYPQEIA